MGGWVEGEVVELKRWHDRLYSLRLRAEVEPFKAGQFNRLGLMIGGERIGRPYSYVNPPQEPVHDFHFVVVPGGDFSHHLADLGPGDPVWLMPGAQGYFTLDEVPDGDSLWLFATGTAIGPYLSILRTADPWQRFERIVLVHAVRIAADLAYGEEIAALGTRWGERFRFIPVVSRERSEGALDGRIPAAIESGVLEARAGVELAAPAAQTMICGNPDMVKDTIAVLERRGFRRNRRREPGHITTENYW